MTITPSRTLSALALAAFIAAPLAASAAPGHQADGARHHQKADQHRGGHHGGMKHSDRWLRGLNLTQAQQDQIFKIRLDQQQAIYDQKKALRTAAKTLRDLGKASSFDQDKAKQAAQELGQAQSQLFLMRAQSMAEIRAVLTPEQQKKLGERRTHRSDKGAKATS